MVYGIASSVVTSVVVYGIASSVVTSAVVANHSLIIGMAASMSS